MSTAVKKMTKDEPVPVTSIAPTIQTIYADRIHNIGFGMAVSKLTLAMEVSDNVVNPFAQVVIPTPALFDMLEFISKAVASDPKLTQSIIDSLDAFKAKLAERQS